MDRLCFYKAGVVWWLRVSWMELSTELGGGVALSSLCASCGGQDIAATLAEVPFGLGCELIFT